jgi:hypothetical protein
MLGTSSWRLRDGEQIIACNRSLLGHRHFLIGVTRVRNEALILRDTLDYAGKHVDAIVAYDDASTDRTLEILGGHPKVALIVTALVLAPLRLMRHSKLNRYNPDRANVSSWPILLQKSKIERRQKSRESGFPDSSTAATLRIANARVRGRFRGKQ